MIELCIGILALYLAAGLVAACVGLFWPGRVTPQRFPATLELLTGVRSRYGRTWGNVPGARVMLQLIPRRGTAGAKSASPDWLLVQVTGFGSRAPFALHSAKAVSKPIWSHDWVAAAPREQLLQRVLEGGSGKSAQRLDVLSDGTIRALAALQIDAAAWSVATLAPVLREVVSVRSEGLAVKAGPDQVSLTLRSWGLDDAMCARAVSALVQAARESAGSAAAEASARRRWSILSVFQSALGLAVAVGLFVVLFAAVLDRAGFAEGVSGEIVGREVRRGRGNSYYFFLQTEQGRREVLVPYNAYHGCGGGRFLREPWSLQVHCGGQSFVHPLTAGVLLLVLLLAICPAGVLSYLAAAAAYGRWGLPPPPAGDHG